ncbi:MAG TPA: hypothetical protein EYH56_02315 [Nanoarchaeota archaeon]|nr:hypothetical protein [Nanoarchaeota archaeon]
MKPSTVLKLIKNSIALFLIFSGSFMLFFPSDIPGLIQTPWKEIIGFFICILGSWLLFKGAVV